MEAGSSQIQALNRTQPTMPMGLGYAEVGCLLQRAVEIVVHFAAETHVDRSLETAPATGPAGSRLLYDSSRRGRPLCRGSGGEPSPTTPSVPWARCAAADAREIAGRSGSRDVLLR